MRKETDLSLLNRKNIKATSLACIDHGCLGDRARRMLVVNAAPGDGLSEAGPGEHRCAQVPDGRR